MQNPIKLCSIFIVLFITNYCSTVPTQTPNIPDPQPSSYDLALLDSLNQIGYPYGMTSYKYETSDKNSILKIKSTEMIYLKNNASKMVIISLYNGNLITPKETIQLHDEAMIKTAMNLSLVKTTFFNLINYSNTPITDKKGYNTLYTLTPTKYKYWSSSKISGTDKWETQRTSPYYYIVKDDTNQLSLMPVIKSGTSYIPSKGTIEASKPTIKIYKKQ